MESRDEMRASGGGLMDREKAKAKAKEKGMRREAERWKRLRKREMRLGWTGPGLGRCVARGRIELKAGWRFTGCPGTNAAASGSLLEAKG